MRTVTLADAGGPDAVRRVVEASGAKVDWEIVPAERALDSLRRTGVGVGSIEAPGVFAEVRPLSEYTVVVRELPGGAVTEPRARRIAHFAFTYAAGHARQRVTVVRAPVLTEVARDVARDYPQIVHDETSEASPPDDFDVILSAGPVAPGDGPRGRFGEGCAVFDGPPGCVAMLLEHIHEGLAADRVLRALRKAAAGAGADEIIRAMKR